MDFLISPSRSMDGVDGRYDERLIAGGYEVGLAHSGNSRHIDGVGGSMAVIAGTVFGPLAERKRLLTADGDELGALALESDGSFAVAPLGGDGVVVVTDAGGSVPVYYAEGPRGTAVGTLVHHVAAAAGCTEIDEVSVVDHLFNSTVCYPYT